MSETKTTLTDCLRKKVYVVSGFLSLENAKLAVVEWLSGIVGAIQSQSRIKIYLDSKNKIGTREEINSTIKEIIEGLKIDR